MSVLSSNALSCVLAFSEYHTAPELCPTMTTLSNLLIFRSLISSGCSGSRSVRSDRVRSPLGFSHTITVPSTFSIWFRNPGSLYNLKTPCGFLNFTSSDVPTSSVGTPSESDSRLPMDLKKSTSAAPPSVMSQSPSIL